MLNMRYIDFVDDDSSTSVVERNQILYTMIDHNAVMQDLKSLGYTIVNFDSGWWGDQTIKIADEHVCFNHFIHYMSLKKFIETTIFSANDIVLYYTELPILELKKSSMLCKFSALSDVKKGIEGPIFVYSHILAPHAPFAVNENGEILTEPVIKNKGEERKKRYLNQLIFVTKQTQEAVNEILSNSNEPPIIIIQSDHGSRISGKVSKLDEKRIWYGNFNAFYLPGYEKNVLFETITPVNTFRFIYKSYFNSSYPLLPDKAYSNNAATMSGFKDITHILEN